MSLTTPSFSNAFLTFQANLATLDPFGLNIPVALELQFAAADHISVYSGTFTPANDTKSIVVGIPTAQSPNVFCFLCDGRALLSSDNNMLAKVPVLNVMFSTLDTIASGTNPISQFLLDGRTAADYPMAQGVAINYTLIIGQATVT